MDVWILILIHQLIFQGMFISKNIILSKKLKKKIRGNNIEANISIAFFVLFIGVAFTISYFNLTFAKVGLLSNDTAMVIGLILISLNLLLSSFSLIDLKESWRVGIIKEQKTKLLTTGIYKYSRNPYFLSYLLMFASYTILLQDIILFALSIVGFLLIHKMVKKEEKYLFSIHGDLFLKYKKSTPRYLLFHHTSFNQKR